MRHDPIDLDEAPGSSWRAILRADYPFPHGLLGFVIHFVWALIRAGYFAGGIILGEGWTPRSPGIASSEIFLSITGIIITLSYIRATFPRVKELQYIVVWETAIIIFTALHRLLFSLAYFTRGYALWVGYVPVFLTIPAVGVGIVGVFKMVRQNWQGFGSMLLPITVMFGVVEVSLGVGISWFGMSGISLGNVWLDLLVRLTFWVMLTGLVLPLYVDVVIAAVREEGIGVPSIGRWWLYPASLAIVVLAMIY